MRSHTLIWTKFYRGSLKKKYFVTFVDQSSRYTHVSRIRYKSVVAFSINDYEDLSETRKHFNTGVVLLLTDGKLKHFSVNIVYKTTIAPETTQHSP